MRPAPRSPMTPWSAWACCLNRPPGPPPSSGAGRRPERPWWYLAAVSPGSTATSSASWDTTAASSKDACVRRTMPHHPPRHASEEEGSKEVAAFDEGSITTRADADPHPQRHARLLPRLQVPVSLRQRQRRRSCAVEDGPRRQAAAQPRGPRRHRQLRRAPQQGNLDPRAGRTAQRGRPDRAHHLCGGPARWTSSHYKGTPRGYDAARGRDAAGNAVGAAAARQALGSKTGLYCRANTSQSTMLQVVGGTDRLAAAFAAARRPRTCAPRCWAPSDRERRVGGLPP